MSSLHPVKKLKTVVVYDTNNLESLLAAACLASVTDITPCDCRGLPPLAEAYVWIGVIPTVYYFANRDPADYKDATHHAIVNINSTKGLKLISLPKVIYNAQSTIPESDAESASAVVVRGYGARGLLERALLHFNINPESFSHLVYMPKNFYLPGASLELLQSVALNAKEALRCLANRETLYIPIPYSSNCAKEAEDAFAEYDAMAKTAINNRCSLDWIKVHETGKAKNVMTFYEQTLWWFIRRRLVRNDFIVRNISLSVTGAIVSSELPYTHNIRVTDPVFVC